MTSEAELTVTVNGARWSGTVPARLTLCDFLRSMLRLTGTHVGCEQGVCGACTVLVNGAAVRSCLMLTVQAEGADVTTVEGMGRPGQLTRLQDAFLRHPRQCRFCTLPCRCGRDPPIRRAVHPRRTSSAAAWARLPLHRLRTDRGSGVRLPRLSADAAQRLVAGRGEYVADLALEGGVEVCFVRSPAAHAALGRVDLGTPRGITAAEPGLRPIALEAGGMVPVAWQPLAVDRVRYVGEPVAMVWAEDRYRAEDLADAVTIDYLPLPPGTPIHEGAPDGVLLSRVLDSGGVDDQLARADLLIERTFRPARQSAVPLEGRGVVADHDRETGVTTVYTSTQLPHLVRRGITDALGADEGSIRVIVPDVGGGFGLKANLYAEEIAVAALARRLVVPVR